jgi:hypothetical protein
MHLSFLNYRYWQAEGYILFGPDSAYSHGHEPPLECTVHRRLLQKVINVMLTSVLFKLVTTKESTANAKGK